MVQIISAAEKAIVAYSAAIALGSNYSVPLQEIASDLSSFFRPGYTLFALGDITISPNQSVMAEAVIKEYTEYRKDGGPGTDIHVVWSRVEPVSDESAICWLTFLINPTNGMDPWDWTNAYGFRAVEGGTENGQDGGWEWANGDNEYSSYEKRFRDGKSK